MQSFTKSQDAALLLLRIIVGVIFLFAAYAKFFVWSGVPEGMMPSWLVGVMKLLTMVEPLGAIAVIAGFLTRWAAAGLTIIMIGAIFVSQFVMHVGFSMPTAPGWNFPLAVLAGIVVLMAFGAGEW